jgi:hypothetical protein
VVKSQIEIKSQKKIKEKEATLKFLNLKIKENERLVIVGQPSEEMNQIKTDFEKLKFEYKTNISLKEEIIKQVFTNLISGMPFKPNSKQFSSITSNFAIFSGINFSKFLISDKALKIYSADFSTFVFGLSKFIVLFFCFRFQVS